VCTGPARTVVEVGGLSRTDADTFAAEFAELSTRLRDTSAPIRTDERHPRG
jgi:hypothetical protein